MPICTLHLVSLRRSTTAPTFLDALRSSPVQPLIVAKVIRWIITPTTLSVNKLIQPPSPWHLFLLVSSETPVLPSDLSDLLSAHWSIQAGIPSRLLQDFPSKNHDLLHPAPDTIPPLTGSLKSPQFAQSSQSLELSQDLHTWITNSANHELTHNNSTAITMLNLLSFYPDPEAKKSYLKYGAAFAQSIGAKRGGLAKIVGSVISPLPTPSIASKTQTATAVKESGKGKWDEVALAHYPSIQHFGDMIASADYQEVNHRFRVGSLRDTAILCLSEGCVEGLWEKEGIKDGMEGEGAMGLEEGGVRSKL